MRECLTQLDWSEYVGQPLSVAAAVVPEVAEESVGPQDERRRCAGTTDYDPGGRLAAPEAPEDDGKKDRRQTKV